MAQESPAGGQAASHNTPEKRAEFRKAALE
jgi:hypothetical protein